MPASNVRMPLRARRGTPLAVLLCASTAWSTSAPGAPATDAAVDDPAPVTDGLRFHRWTEDYSALAGREAELRGLDRLKYVPLGDGGAHLSVGGQYRARLEAFADPSYGLAGTDDFAALNHRLLLHADLRTGRRVRFFGQLGHYLQDGREPGPRAVDRSEPDLQLGFADVDLSRTADGSALVRVGRQELVLPSSRLLGIREGPNQRRAFDGAWAALSSPERGTVRAWYARPVVPRDDAFDDEGADGEGFWGVYATVQSAARDATLDLFYLGRRVDDRSWFQGTGDERRHTVGARVAGVAGPWGIDYQAAWQFGRFGDADVAAWGVATETSLDLPGAWSPRLVLRANVASGDDDASDPDLGSFDALYPNLAYFTEAAVYAPTNAVDVHPRLELAPRPDVEIGLGLTSIWRVSKDDGVYAAGYRPLVAPDASDARHVTTFVGVDAAWRLTPRIELAGSVVYGRAGEVIEDAGGTDVRFLSLEADFRF